MTVELRLWPFQGDVCRESQRALRSYRRIVVIVPTGGGKTAISGAISLQLARELAGREGGIALYLVHRKELIRQTARTLDRVGLAGEYGILARDYPRTPWAPMQIGSIPYLRDKLDAIAEWLNPAVIFLDEAHHAAAESWAKVLATWPNAFLIGLTATPARLDGKGLKKFFDHLVLGPQISDLIPEYLCPVRMFQIPPSVDLKDLRKGGRDFTKASLAAVKTGPVIADAVKAWQRHAPDRRTIFFAVDIEHSKSIQQRLAAAGVSAAHVDFKTPNRERILDQYQDGAIQCLTNVELFTEGMDAPATNCVVHARPTASFTLWRQMNGRGFRVKPDGGDLIVVDAANNSRLHGDPDADVTWELEHGVLPEERKKLATTSRRCDNCDYVYPRTNAFCPLCGVAPYRDEVEEVDVELEESKGGGTDPIKPTRRELSARILATGGDMDLLRELGKEYGYHAMWADRIKQVYRFAWR